MLYGLIQQVLWSLLVGLYWTLLTQMSCTSLSSFVTNCCPGLNIIQAIMIPVT